MTKTSLFAKYQSGGQFNVIDQAGVTTGNVWFVDSGSAQALDQAGSGYNPDYPFATIDFAIGQCVANNGDVIYVMSGHTELLAGAGSIACDVAGIKIIGLGYGYDRPTITANAAAGSLVITCSTWLENLRFTTNVDITTGMINVAAVDSVIKNCEFEDTTGEASDVIITTNAAWRLLIDGWKHIGAAGAGANSAIAIVGAQDIELRNLNIVGNFAVGAIDVRTTATARIWIHDFKIQTLNAADIAIIDTITTSTGIIGPNGSVMLTDHAANITEACTGATFFYFDPIYVCNLLGEKGMLINKIASA